LTISLNPNNIGTVNNITNEIISIVGYSKDDILKQNVSELMPKVFADIHNEYLVNNLNSSE